MTRQTVDLILVTVIAASPAIIILGLVSREITKNAAWEPVVVVALVIFLLAAFAWLYAIQFGYQG